MALNTYIYTVMTDKRHDLVSKIVKVVLLILSFVYGMVVYVVRCLYSLNILSSYHSPKPVLSVGNITVGGVGKTPIVIAIVQALSARQLRVAVLTRGYKLKGSMFSDEARMLQESLPGIPILVGSNRQASIEEGLKHHAIDVFVCDDAFQHWPLKRDLDIVAVDAVNAFGNGCLLPRGILRELPSALKRAQVVVLTKTGHPQARTEAVRQRLHQIHQGALVVESRHHTAGCVDVFQKTAHDHYHLKGVSVVAFCGIADPNSFRQSLADAGFNVVNVFVFMDHHAYTAEDMAMVRKYAHDHHVLTIMTTHKDAVKILDFEKFWQGFKVYYLQVELEFTHGKNVFLERIVRASRR